MNIRQWLDNNSTVVTGVALVVTVVAMGVVVLQLRGPAPPQRDVYFWDMQRGEPFVHRAHVIPPVEAPSGGDGVRAYLYTCGECEPGEWFGYLERYTDEAKRMYEEQDTLPEEDPIRVRDLHGDRWVPYESREGDNILGAIYERCEEPRECLP